MSVANASGYTTTVSPLQMYAGFTATNKLVGGAIRSITIGNQTTSTTVAVYSGSSALGDPLVTVIPGNLLTIPLASLSAVTLMFTSSTTYDGSVFVHVDPTALSASGFVLQAAIVTSFTSPITGTSAQFSGGFAAQSVTGNSVFAVNEVYAGNTIIGQSLVQSNGNITAVGSILANINFNSQCLLNGQYIGTILVGSPQPGTPTVTAQGSIGGCMTDDHWAIANTANTAYMPLYASQFLVASDAAFKSDAMPFASGLASIAGLKPCTYNRLGTAGRQIGFLAQDVQAVLPQTVVTDAQGKQLVDYGALIPVLVHAIQELQSQIAALQAAK